MFAELKEYLKRPSLYERTTEQFWTDSHISAQMLKSHLDPNTDGASRQHEFMDRSAEWIVSLPIPTNACLLDIGCGPGLYTKRFADRNLRVTGMDFSERSIKYAEEHEPKSKYILQDYLTLDFDSVFDIITLINCDYGALIPKEREIILPRIHRALKPGGLFLFDVFTPLLNRGKKDRNSWKVYPDGDFWSSKPHICLHADYYFDDVASGRRTVIIEEGKVRCFNLWDCYFTKQSLLDETSPIGFSELGFYSDVAGKPCSDDSTMLCAVLKKDGKAL